MDNQELVLDLYRDIVRQDDKRVLGVLLYWDVEVLRCRVGLEKLDVLLRVKSMKRWISHPGPRAQIARRISTQSTNLHDIVQLLATEELCDLLDVLDGSELHPLNLVLVELVRRSDTSFRRCEQVLHVFV